MRDTVSLRAESSGRCIEKDEDMQGLDEPHTRDVSNSLGMGCSRLDRSEVDVRARQLC